MQENYREIVAAYYVEGYKLRLIFSNKREFVVDFEPFLMAPQHPMTMKYRNKRLFRKVRVENGDIEWNGGEMEFYGPDLYGLAVLLPHQHKSPSIG